MNGRLYDPVLGRILSPDPYIQLPGFAQNYNRYSYVWNNPLVYSDPSGEFIPLVFVGAAIIGGSINLWNNFDKVDNVWEGIAYFGTGAVGGAATVINPFAGGALTAGGNMGIDLVTGEIPDNLGDWGSYLTRTAFDMLAISGSGKIAQEVINSFPNLLNRGIGNFKSVKMAWDDGIKGLVAVTEGEFVVTASKVTSNTSEFLKNIVVKPALTQLKKTENWAAAGADAINQSAWILSDPSKNIGNFNFSGTLTNLMGFGSVSQSVVSNSFQYTANDGFNFYLNRQSLINSFFGSAGNKFAKYNLKDARYLKSLNTLTLYTGTNFIGNSQANYLNTKWRNEFLFGQ